jgi:PAS domain-containing protein
MRRVAVLILVVGSAYLAAAIFLLLALEAGIDAPQTMGAIGAGLAAVAALVAFLFGRGASRAAPSPAAAPLPPPAAAPASPKSAATGIGAEVAFLRHFFLDIVEALPVGFATLDRRFVVKSANRALRTLLGVQDGTPLAGVPLHGTPLGSAIYDGPRMSLAGRAFHEIARECAPREGPLELAPLLVPKNGEPWAARLRARLEPWPAPPAAPDHFILWAEIERVESGIPAARGDDGARAELTRTRERLLEEALLRDALLAALPLGVILLDSAGALLGWSDPVRAVLGREIALREGRPLAEAWPDFAAPPHRDALEALLARGAPFVARLPAPAAAAAPGAPASRRERIVRATPVGIPDVTPRRFLLLVEERWEPAAIAALDAELAAARARGPLLAARVSEIRSRLDVLSSVARFLGEALSGADVATLAEIRMIEIQRERIETALGALPEAAAPPRPADRPAPADAARPKTA